MTLCIFVACLCMGEYDYRHLDDPICKIYKRRNTINRMLNFACIFLICAVTTSVVALPWIPAVLSVMLVVYTLIMAYRTLKKK